MRWSWKEKSQHEIEIVKNILDIFVQVNMI